MVAGGRDAVDARSSRRSDVQGLRAIAVLLVVVYHTGHALPGGFIGVDVFFVISGYVISRMLLTELDSTGKISFRHFYTRRIRRILPALALMLVVVQLADVGLGTFASHRVTARTGFAAALFNANTSLIRFGNGGYFQTGADVQPLLHTWSLSVEEQFYLVFPAILFAAWAFGRRRGPVVARRVVAVALASITAASFALSWVITYGGPRVFGLVSDKVAFYSAPTRAWEFAVGGVLFMVAAPLRQLGRRTATVIALVGFALLAFGAVAIDDLTPFPGLAAVIPVGGTVLLIAAGERSDGTFVSRWLAWRPAQRLGDLSYSWYLWHWPMIVFSVALWPDTRWVTIVAAAVSVVPAVLAYRLVENPIRLEPSPRARRTAGIAVICVTTPLIAAGVLQLGHTLLAKTDSFQAFMQAFEPHAVRVAECDTRALLGEQTRSGCSPSTADGRGRAVLIGDSNAKHFTEPVISAFIASDIDVSVTTRPGCPFLDIVIIKRRDIDTACRKFVTDSMRDLIELRPEVVLIAAASDSYLSTRSTVLVHPSSGAKARSSDAKAAAWSAALHRTINELEAADIQVAIVHPIPKFPDWSPKRCAVARWVVDPDSCGRSATTAHVAQQRNLALTAELEAMNRTGAVGIDVFDALCSDQVCTTHVGGTWLWRDGGHISVGASDRVEPYFAEFARNRRES